MTAPWPPPPSTPVRTAPSTAGPLIGWLLLLVSSGAALAAVVADPVWVTGRLSTGRVTGLGLDELVGQGYGALPFAALATVVGLVVATCFGLAAVPGGRVGRVVVTAVFAVPVTLSSVSGLTDDSVTPREGITLVALLVWLPALVLLVLVWRGARRGSAWTAGVFAALAAFGALLVLVDVLSGLGSPGPGVWVALLLAVVGLAGAVVQLRSIPRRAPALQPGDPGWTAS